MNATSFPQSCIPRARDLEPFGSVTPARGHGDLDWSAFSRIEAEEAGERAAPARGP